jgi:prevent-host-death family protein
MKRGTYRLHDWVALRGPIRRALNEKTIFEVAEEFGIKFNTLKHFVYTNRIATPVKKTRKKAFPRSSYLSSEEVKSHALRVTSSNFRSEIGRYYDQVNKDGVIVITSERRGTFVLMTADEYNFLKTARSIPQQKKKQKTNENNED